MRDAGDRFELPMHLAYETGVVTALPAMYSLLWRFNQDLHIAKIYLLLFFREF